MPVVEIDPDTLRRRLGKAVDEDELIETIPKLGADVEDTDDDAWRIELFPDRPDLYTAEGLARALRAFLDLEPGLATYEVAEPTTTLTVDPDLADVRPIIGAAWVRDVRLDDDTIQALMSLQEDLHWGLGSRRKRVAIGLHDARDLQPPFRYEAIARDGIAFTPLVGPQEQVPVGEAMTPGEILADHPKGQEYAHILDGAEKVPIILDADDNVLSFPPIINGTITAVSEDTTELFVDTTGTHAGPLTKVLNILTATLAETGATLEAVTIDTPFDDAPALTPDLAPTDRRLDVADVNAWLGTTLDAADTAEALRRMGYGAEPGDDPDGDHVQVQVPAWRADILHDVDLHEDVAIGLDLGSLTPDQPRHPTTGQALEWRRDQARIRQVLIGLGFVEAMTLTLASDETEFDRTRRDPLPGVTLDNPVSEDQARPRRTLLPSLLEILALNTHRDYPQALFETGTVVDADAKNRRRVALVRAAADAGFTDVKGVMQRLVEDGLGAEEFDVEPAEDALFVDGRAAAVLADGEAVGVFGEVHPEVLERFEVEVPVIAGEVGTA